MGPSAQRARKVVRHQGLLRMAGNEEVQDSRSRETREVPKLRAVPAVSWITTQSGGRLRQVSRSHNRRSLFDGRQIRATFLGIPPDVETGRGDRGTSAPRDRE